MSAVPLPSTRPFNLKSGAVHQDPQLTPGEAWQSIVSDAFLACLVEQARSKPGSEETTKADAQRYMIAVIAIGLACPQKEADLWHADRKDLPGILGCAYVQDLLTRRDWQTFKKIFAGDRAALTKAFNTTASPGNFVIPNRYIF